MAPPPPPPRRDLPALPDEIFEEILLRLPPDDPACLLRASLVCKTWSCAVSSPGFRRRLHELHRTPPVLGFLHNWDQDARELLIWEPITGAQRRIPVPASSDCRRWWPTAAVFCATDGCDHRYCHWGPFHLVYVFSADKYVTSACLYSSEIGAWGELTSMQGDFGIDFTFSSSVLVGRSLFYSSSDDGFIVEYDLARHGLTLLDPPESYFFHDSCNLILTEDGGLGVSKAVDQHLKLWSRKASDGTNAQWVLSRVIYLENLLPEGAFVNARSTFNVLGFAEGANVIFVFTGVGLFTIELQSQRMRKVCGDHGFRHVIPIVSFYSPAPYGEHQDSPSVPSYGKVALEGANTLNKYGCAPCYQSSRGDRSSG